MADTRLPVQGAGRHRLTYSVVWAVAWVGACAQPGAPVTSEDRTAGARSGAAQSPTGRILIPARPLLGGRLASSDATGSPRPGSARTFRAFRYPSALAIRGPDLYVVDGGSGEILRFDTIQQVLTAPVPSVRASNRTRIRVGIDGSLYVMDPATASIQRFGRGGQRLNAYADPLNLSSPVDFVVDEARGRLIAADASLQQLLAFHPGGGASYVVVGVAGEGGPIRAVAGLASIRGGVIVSDVGCGCLVEVSLDSGRMTDFGHEVLRQPGPVAVDRHGRVYVLDGGDRSIKIFRERRHVATIGYGSLGLMLPSSIVTDADTLYLADGPASRVLTFRIAPPAKGEEG